MLVFLVCIQIIFVFLQITKRFPILRIYVKSANIFDGLFAFFGLGNKITLPYCYRSSEMSEYPPIPTCTIISANKQHSSEMTDIALSCNIMLLSSTSMGKPLITHQQDDPLEVSLKTKRDPSFVLTTTECNGLIIFI